MFNSRFARCIGKRSLLGVFVVVITQHTSLFFTHTPQAALELYQSQG
ncbi:MAG: hypothetical protein ABJ051_08025 [Lentilitoribacter sp.]